MTVDKAIEKAFSRFKKAGLKKQNMAAISIEAIYPLALLYMIEDLTRVISSGSRSASSTRAK